jgi:ribonuclease HI
MTVNKVEEFSQGMIIYCDGGCRPSNPGNIGWGMHGYIYQKTAPKKGAGNLTHILTNKGYVLKTNEISPGATEVKPISYIDAFGSYLIHATNNVAEIRATIFTLNKASEYAITDLTIYTDSTYVCKGISEWSPIWVKRDWIKIDGTPVPNATEWKLLLAALEKLTARGVNVKVEWVKAHSGILGNEMADELATIGVMTSLSGVEKTECNVSVAEGYWKSTVDKHPFISNRRMYFNTLHDSLILGEYYLGEHGADDDMVAKKTSDGTYAVVQLKENDHVLEKLRSYQADLNRGVDSIVMVRLDKLYSPAIYKQLNSYGPTCLVKTNNYSIDLDCLDKDPLTKELRPPRLAMRAIESLSILKSLLDKYKNKDTSLQMFDLTNILYAKEENKKKDKITITTKFKSEYNVGFCALPLEIDLKTDRGIVKTKFNLALGVDLLDRNALKHLESLEPVVTLLVWNESPDVVRYATVIESLGSYGIWCGFYSNMIVIKPSNV